MLLTLTTTHEPATDLGFLLHKNPSRSQAFDLSFGRVHVFYPEASAIRCTAAMLLEVDAIGLVRNHRGPPGENFALAQYVNDRPYVASSFLSVAISQVLGSALAGTSRERPALAAAIPLTATISVLPCRGGESFLRRLFEPLGYVVTATHHSLDESFPEWGDGPYFTVELTQTIALHRLLSHLYVLIPVLDNDKHYWIGEDEIEKLLRHGETWLADHPEKVQIVERYLKHQRHLARSALAQLLEADQQSVDESETAHASEELQVEEKISLNQRRHEAVVEVLKAAEARSVLDLGCSSGKLLRRLLDEKQFDRIVGIDVAYRALEVAAEKLHLDRLPPKQRARIELLHGSLTYRDTRLAGFDAAAIVEVIEHLDSQRLAAFERVVFEFAKPGVVIVTTPNIEYNVRFETLPAGKFRHKDHRFEWTREQFASWADAVASRFNYTTTFNGVGNDDPDVGQPTQMAIFRRVSSIAGSQA